MSDALILENFESGISKHSTTSMCMDNSSKALSASTTSCELNHAKASDYHVHTPSSEAMNATTERDTEASEQEIARQTEQKESVPRVQNSDGPFEPQPAISKQHMGSEDVTGPVKQVHVSSL